MKAVMLLALAVLLAGCKAGPRTYTPEPMEVQPQEPVIHWSYHTEGSAFWACRKSVDEAAELCFRRSKGHLDSYLDLPEEGNPFFCYRKHCPTKIRADAGAVQAVEGTNDENGGTRILFLPDSARLLDEVQHAKELRVDPPMFGKDQEFVFEVSGLNWQ